MYEEKSVNFNSCGTDNFRMCHIFLCKNIGGNEKDSQKLMDSEVVLASSKEGYNSIVVYQKKNILVVSAKSEAAFLKEHNMR